MAHVTIILCDPDGVPIPGAAPIEMESSEPEDRVHYYRMERADYEAMRPHLPAVPPPPRPDGIDEPFHDEPA